MRSSELLAHLPDESLIDHLRNVSQLATKYASNDIREMAEIAGICHDIGKSTSFFQQYLKAKNTGRKFQGDSKTHHAYLSGIFAAWVARSRGLEPLPVFMAVARHHGHLRSPSEITARLASQNDVQYVKDPLGCELKAMIYQVDDLLKSGNLVTICNELNLPEPTPFLKKEAWPLIGDLHKKGKEINRNSDNRRAYWTVNRLFSCLIDADKKASGGFRAPDRPDIPSDIVDRYVQSLPSRSALDEMRKELYCQVDKIITKEPLDKLRAHPLTLTAPTGSGKTLTVLNAGIKLRDRIYRNGDNTPRIIYALPFINIIKQNHDVFHKVLRQYSPYNKNPYNFLIQHHHLAPINDGADNELKALEERLMLTDSWDAEIVVTTFAQLLHTLIANRNRSLKKLHNIENSIIILDEPQSIPADQWPLIKSVFDDLKDLNVTVIMMTATQPSIFDNALEMAPKIPAWPSRCNVERTEKRNLEELVQDVVAGPNVSRLVVVNTVRTSIEVFNRLKDVLDHPVFYLSTNITPHERSIRLDKLRKLLNLKKTEPVTLVSTQVIEAGVDIDFERGYREMGPLDSVVQVAGRINRNSRRKNGILYVFELEDSQADRIYGRILLDTSAKHLVGSLSDKELDRLTPTYFQDIASKKAKDVTILDAMTRLRYDDSQRNPVSSYRFIQDLPSAQIIVELNNEVTTKLKQLHDAFGIEDPYERRTRMKILRYKLELYTISTPLFRIKQNKPPLLFQDDKTIVRDDIHIIHREDIEWYYDTRNDGMDGTGFKFLPNDVIESQFT